MTSKVSEKAKMVKLGKAANYGIKFVDPRPVYQFTAAQRTVNTKLSEITLDGVIIWQLNKDGKVEIAENMPGWAAWCIDLAVLANLGGLSTAYGRAFSVHCAHNVSKFSEVIAPVVSSEKELTFTWGDLKVWTTPKNLFTVALTQAGVVLTTQENTPYTEEVVEKAAKKEVTKLDGSLF